MPILKPSPVGMGTGDSWRKKKIFLGMNWWDSNPQLFSLQSSALTARPTVNSLY